MLANWPLVRITPPSEPSKIWVGLFGLTAITCSSGWIPFGAFSQPLSKYGAYAHQLGWLIVASYVRSVNVRRLATPVAAPSGSPAVVEYSTVRPFDRPFPQPTPFVLQGCSPYSIDPMT